MTEKQISPFGLWKSPITEAMVGEGGRLEDVQWDSDGRTLVWLEGRSDKDILLAGGLDQASRALADQNVRAWVGYGGGDFSVSNGVVFFVDVSGKIFRRSLGSEIPRPITPAYGSASTPRLSPDGRWLLYVFSDLHTDLLAMVDANGEKWPWQISRGADFYMQPAWHPSGKRIAWVEWDHPNMPWDQTRIKLATLAGDMAMPANVQIIADEEDKAAVQPLFSPDGRWLSYIIHSGEWEDLVLLDLETGKKQVLVHGDGFHQATPAWGQGARSYGWSGTSQKIYNIRNSGGYATLWEVEVPSGKARQIDTKPYTWLGQLSVSPRADQCAFIASAPDVPTRVVAWDGERLRTLAYSSPEMIDAAFLPHPQALTWKAADGTKVYGSYYAPANPQFTGNGLPPALIYCHGGPTSGDPVSYNVQRSYFTSRGYGWLDLDYRGSTGYGHSYRKLMRQRWGDVDTDDADGACQALIDNKLADGKRLIIIGGSAGGYMVLNALVRYPGRFKAGVDLFGVSNLFNLALDTHKFESRYTDSMVGPLPEAADRYREWSAIFHADRIRDPLAVFQGAIDPVVPPNQSEDIVAVLQRNGVPYIYKKYEGEGHGFRKTETYIDFLQQTDRFLRQYVLFA
jgi:dipeptidyl aminopeptidase/acylaminoacyl peptidase